MAPSKELLNIQTFVSLPNRERCCYKPRGQSRFDVTSRGEIDHVTEGLWGYLGH